MRSSRWLRLESYLEPQRLELALSTFDAKDTQELRIGLGRALYSNCWTNSRTR